MPTISGTVTDVDGSPASGYTIRFYRRDNGVLLGETTTGTGSPGASDPDWASVRVLIPGVDTTGLGVVNEVTTQTISPLTGLSYSTEVVGLGPTQVKMSNNPLVCTADGAAPGYTTSFTAECFLQYETAVVAESSPLPIFGMTGRLSNGADATMASVRLTSNGALELKGRAAVADTPVLSANGVFVPGVRYFLRVVQTVADSTTRLYLNGALLLTHVSTVFPTLPVTSLVKLTMRGYGSLNYADAVRITDGVVRTTPAIPAAPWPTSAAAPATTIGTYTFTTPYTGEVNVVCLDNAAGTVENDLILRTNVT